MKTYGLSPPSGLCLARIAGLAADAGGAASLRQTVREDGSPGVPILDVTVPDGVSPETVEGWVAEATGVSDAEQAAWEAERLRDQAAAQASTLAPLPLAVSAALELTRQGIAADRAGDARREARSLAMTAAIRRIEQHLGLTPHQIPDEDGVPAESPMDRERAEEAVQQIVAVMLGLPPAGG